MKPSQALILQISSVLALTLRSDKAQLLTVQSSNYKIHGLLACASSFTLTLRQPILFQQTALAPNGMSGAAGNCLGWRVGLHTCARANSMQHQITLGFSSSKQPCASPMKILRLLRERDVMIDDKICEFTVSNIIFTFGDDERYFWHGSWAYVPILFDPVVSPQ